jgi:Anti-sigma factor NepR
MQEIRYRAFGPHPVGARDSLMIARNLARLYADVLEEPLPPDLARLIGRLEERLTSQRGGRGEGQAG